MRTRNVHSERDHRSPKPFEFGIIVTRPQPTPVEPWQFDARSEADTEALGNALAGVLEPGSIVALVGDLGAGKTRLVQAVAVALDVDRRAVRSPTFILIHEYEGRLPIYHFDTYRLANSDEFLELGADEIMASGGVCLIEWADRVADVLPADRLTIEIEITGPQSRAFRFTPTGPNSTDILMRLSEGMEKRGESRVER